MRRIFSIISCYIRAIYHIIGVIGLLLLFYFAIDMQKPVIIVHGGEILNKSVNPGDKLRVKWKITTLDKCDTEVNRHLWGECGIYQLDGYKGHFPGKPGGAEEHLIIVDIPESVDPGICHYRAEANFYCNPLSRLFPKNFIFPDLPFEVKKPDGDLQ